MPPLFHTLQFLDPDPDAVETLRQGLLESNIGIVAHYYMDVELQGVLQALKLPHMSQESKRESTGRPQEPLEGGTKILVAPEESSCPCCC